MTIPTDLHYTKTHEWLRLEGDVATVGITEHAQGLLGELVFVELPEVGRHVEPTEAVAVVESVKAASDVYAPVAGEVVAVNPALSDAPDLVNKAAFGNGWLFRLKVATPLDPTGLLDAAGYRQEHNL